MGTWPPSEALHSDKAYVRRSECSGSSQRGQQQWDGLPGKNWGKWCLVQLLDTVKRSVDTAPHFRGPRSGPPFSTSFSTERGVHEAKGRCSPHVSATPQVSGTCSSLPRWLGAAWVYTGLFLWSILLRMNYAAGEASASPRGGKEAVFMYGDWMRQQGCLHVGTKPLAGLGRAGVGREGDRSLRPRAGGPLSQHHHKVWDF